MLSLHLDETTTSAPGLSPGIVRDEECLLREIYDPYHVENGRFKPTIVPIEDLREKGFSVHRIRHTSIDSLRSAISTKLSMLRKGGSWKAAFVCRLHTGTVRRIHIDCEQAFVVIDTASPDDRGHASIYAADPGRGKAHARELRSLLLPYLDAGIQPYDSNFQLS